MSAQRAPLNQGGFTLWKIDAKDAHAHPTGTEYAGLARTPDGQLWGIHACVREINGRKHFEGGLYPVDRYAEALQPPAAPPVPACAESRAVHSAMPSPGKLTDTPPEFDDSLILEELPL